MPAPDQSIPPALLDVAADADAILRDDFGFQATYIPASGLAGGPVLVRASEKPLVYTGGGGSGPVARASNGTDRKRKLWAISVLAPAPDAEIPEAATVVGQAVVKLGTGDQLECPGWAVERPDEASVTLRVGGLIERIGGKWNAEAS